MYITWHRMKLLMMIQKRFGARLRSGLFNNPLLHTLCEGPANTSAFTPHQLDNFTGDRL
ncbi:hypothetical protein D3C79_492560 [compost metagenome]